MDVRKGIVTTPEGVGWLASGSVGRWVSGSVGWFISGLVEIGVGLGFRIWEQVCSWAKGEEADGLLNPDHGFTFIMRLNCIVFLHNIKRVISVTQLTFSAVKC